MKKCESASEATTPSIAPANAAKPVRVKVTFGDEETVLRIEDDGCGFDVERVHPDAGRLGLASMRLRAEQLGGSLDLTSEIGKGTSLVVKVPNGST